ncbi:SsrA-binding protein [Tessaracoccus bendigoensis DSM 12906]|uniref:SsrA-binding protein n=1 Tax=Tessaracoccus bendigoensis DSM 12906 TaxID=1123357 RepID=A0A1M6G9P1_9ACTN|nr:SsrA-binding protein SmpB [Tessaracoccus bendigoensis]SHJ06557.1 SsrA-binding protein [Tessaracoccus bendigoensis DSM 12906]
MPREVGRKLVAQNKKARHDYQIGDVYEAGLVLTGTEVKTLRAGRATLTDAYASVDDGGEAWLINANIPEYEFGTWRNHSARRTRKLLLHKAEINKLVRALDNSGRTLIPLSIYFKDGYAKVEIAVATGKKDWDKRRDLAERDAKREAERALATRNRYNRR